MANSGSAQEYQDNDFSDELGVSDPTHPLFPTSQFSNSATNHMRGAAKTCRQEDVARWASIK